MLRHKDNSEDFASELAEEEESMIFSEEDVAEAVSAFERRQSLLPFLQAEMIPLIRGQKGYAVDVDAAQLHAGVIALCLPGPSLSRWGAKDAVERRASRQRVPHCTVIICPTALRVRNDVRGIVAEVILPLARSCEHIPIEGIAFEAPYHFVGGLFGRGGFAEKAGTQMLLYNPEEKLFRISALGSEGYLTIAVKPLSAPPPPLNTGVKAEKEYVFAQAYVQALDRLKMSILNNGRPDRQSIFELRSGRAIALSQHSVTEVTDENLVGLSLRFPYQQLAPLRTLLRRLRSSVTVHQHDGLFHLTGGELSVAFKAAPPGEQSSELFNRIADPRITIELPTNDLLRGLFCLSIVATMDDDCGNPVTLSIEEAYRGGMLLSVRSTAAPQQTGTSHISILSDGLDDDMVVKMSAGLLLSAIEPIVCETTVMCLSDRHIMIVEAAGGRRIRQVLSLQNLSSCERGADGKMERMERARHLGVLSNS